MTRDLQETKQRDQSLPESRVQSPESPEMRTYLVTRRGTYTVGWGVHTHICFKNLCCSYRHVHTYTCTCTRTLVRVHMYIFMYMCVQVHVCVTCYCTWRCSIQFGRRNAPPVPPRPGAHASSRQYVCSRLACGTGQLAKGTGQLNASWP